jgi:hypothetical protein
VANVAAQSIHSDLGASGAAHELGIGGYLIAFAVLLISGARLGQTHGYRPIIDRGEPSPLALEANTIAHT